MKRMFEVAAGTVMGRDHLMFSSNKSNQDAFRSVIFGDSLVAVVCDGCGSSVHSEVGSQIGVRLVVEAIVAMANNLLGTEDENSLNNFFEKVEQNILSQIKALAVAMGGSFSETVDDYFLFTIVGVLITKESTILFSFGDGVFFLNGEMIKIDPFAQNAPPYLAYKLFRQDLIKIDADFLRFQINRVLPTRDVESILLGSDGVIDLTQVADKCLPGRAEIVGPVSQFWEEDKFFKNPDMIRRKLAMINNESTRIDWTLQCTMKFPGLLRDDTTVVVIRKKKEG